MDDVSAEHTENKTLRDEVEAHFNEPMLCGTELVRCVGYGEDAIDCYIITRRPNPHGDVMWITLVGGYTYLNRLKGQGYVKGNTGEDWDDLFRLDSTLTLNGAPKEEKFIVKIEHNDETFWNNAPTREQLVKAAVKFQVKSMRLLKVDTIDIFLLAAQLYATSDEIKEALLGLESYFKVSQVENDDSIFAIAYEHYE
jgi:hypothetical protein